MFRSRKIYGTLNVQVLTLKKSDLEMIESATQVQFT